MNEVDRCSTNSKQLKIKFLVFEFCFITPLISVLISKLWGSEISSGVTIAGPNGQWVSKDFPIVKVGTLSCQSLTLTSLETQYPAITLWASFFVVSYVL